ncbi:UNVERIFIED_CONTAM: hypothetical protein Slati_1366300 [Sesamum latifolium]|uniref:Uncharacterized protein n=1 Tax=Sesamum latifolium TaxID=2727402 RepID=A0AAW2XI77_9LAMI
MQDENIGENDEEGSSTEVEEGEESMATNGEEERATNPIFLDKVPSSFLEANACHPREKYGIPESYVIYLPS